MRKKWPWIALCALACIALSLGLSGSASAGADAVEAPGGVPESRVIELSQALIVRRYEEGDVSALGEGRIAGGAAAAYEMPLCLALIFGAGYLICEGVASRDKKRR